VNGQRYLVQVTGEEAQSSASGDTHLVRMTSSSDANGNLQVMQREVADTQKIGPNAQETKTTFYILDGNGRLNPSLQTQEIAMRSASSTGLSAQTRWGISIRFLNRRSGVRTSPAPPFHSLMYRRLCVFNS
jgi:hypothetical protein